MTFEFPTPVSPVSRSAYVVEHIRKGILRGDFSSGQPLVETELAKAFSMSKTPVREALKILSGDGLVTMSEYRGAVVRSVDAAMARGVFEVRTLLEPAAVALSTRAGIDTSLAREALRRAASATDRVDRSSANRDFHRLTYASCGNPLLVSMLDGLRDQTAFITVTAWKQGISWKHEAHEHEAILDAIEAGNAEEAQTLDDEHIRRFAANAVAQLEASTS